MLAVIIWNNQNSKLLPECSRDRSRIVREILTTVSVWMQIFVGFINLVAFVII